MTTSSPDDCQEASTSNEQELQLNHLARWVQHKGGQIKGTDANVHQLRLQRDSENDSRHSSSQLSVHKALTYPEGQSASALGHSQNGQMLASRLWTHRIIHMIVSTTARNMRRDPVRPPHVRTCEADVTDDHDCQCVRVYIANHFSGPCLLFCVHRRSTSMWPA